MKLLVWLEEILKYVKTIFRDYLNYLKLETDQLYLNMYYKICKELMQSIFYKLGVKKQKMPSTASQDQNKQAHF